jgi:hypothetical protein
MGGSLPLANTYATIYPVEEIIPVNEAGLIQDRFPQAVIGGDGSREMLAYDFRHDEPSLAHARCCPAPCFPVTLAGGKSQFDCRRRISAGVKKRQPQRPAARTW